MNLKDLLTSKDSPPELYWSIVIEKGLVQSGIWYLEEGSVQIIGIGAAVPWEDEEGIIEATDATLSSAIQKLPEEYPEPQKTVFGVSASWVKDGEISPENLVKIKKICTELTLTPVGFVVLPEAIAHLYKSEEGSPLNAIILKTGRETLELSVFKLGELAGTTEVSRSVSLVDDVVEGLSRFAGVNPLPTRFVVYNGKEGELEEVRQFLLQADWKEANVDFLHTPQVEIFPPDKKILATALAGGSEIGGATAINVNEEENTPESTAEVAPEAVNVVQELVSAEDLGFRVETDVSSIKNEEVENVIPAPPVFSQPVQQVSTPMQNYQQQGPSMQQPIIKKPKVDYLAKSKSLFHSFTRIFTGVGKPVAVGDSGKRKFVIPVSIIGLAVLLFFFLWYFTQKATVDIYVVPQKAEENTRVTFDSGGGSDIGAGIVPAEILTTEASGEKTKQTTGTKLIGNKAKGSVQIANGNSAAINLVAGTSLTSSSGFKFVTDTEASVSGQLLPGSPGTATVNVTAYDIGSQYNLAKGEVFSVGNYSKALVAATSIGNFEGGSSQQISAVGKDDQTNLENDLKNELIQNALSDLSAKVSDNKIFVSGLAGVEITDENFDHKIGEEAESLKLSLSIKAIGVAADKEKLFEYAKNLLNDKTPPNYSLSPDQIGFKFNFVSEADGKYVYDVVISGNFLPNVDTENIKKAILGRSSKSATDYLNSIPSFDHAAITLKWKFPGFLQTIPRIANNITVNVKPE